MTLFSDAPLAAVLAIAAVISFAILLTLLKTGLAWDIAVDIPNHRSLHHRPVPRIGGWGILPSALGIGALTAPSLRLVIVGAAILAVISQVDDRRGLPARLRFFAHLLVAAAMVVISAVHVSWWLGVLACVAMVWLVNLYNFMDGSNGLAGGMAVFGFGTYALAAAGVDSGLAICATAIAGAAIGFLLLNFRPARIFLGDVGSIPLGFMAGALGYWGWQHSVWPLWFPALTFSPFIADSTVTLLRRLARRERVWEAHREHYYQRLVQMGATHVRVALLYYLLMSVGSAVALVSLRLSLTTQWVMVFCWYLLLAVIGWQIDRRWAVWRS